MFIYIYFCNILKLFISRTIIVNNHDTKFEAIKRLIVKKKVFVFFQITLNAVLQVIPTLQRLTIYECTHRTCPATWCYQVGL